MSFSSHCYLSFTEREKYEKQNAKNALGERGNSNSTTKIRPRARQLPLTQIGPGVSPIIVLVQCNQGRGSRGSAGPGPLWKNEKWPLPKKNRNWHPRRLSQKLKFDC